MRAGDLRKRITLQQRATLPSPDSYGQPTTDWTDLFTVWASIEGLSVRELLAAEAVQAEITHKVTARYRSEFANPQTVAAMRMIYNGRIFNISGVLNIDERNRVVVFSVSEGLNNG